VKRWAIALVAVGLAACGPAAAPRGAPAGPQAGEQMPGDLIDKSDPQRVTGDELPPKGHRGLGCDAGNAFMQVFRMTPLGWCMGGGRAGGGDGLKGAGILLVGGGAALRRGRRRRPDRDRR
jgi:hypothetical protein